MASPDLIAAMDKYQLSLGVRSVAVPEWDVTFYVSPMTLKEQSIMHGWKSRSRDEQLQVYAKIVVMKACDDAGARLYTDKDFTLLLDKDYELLSRVATEMMATPEVEEIKNS